MFSQKLNKDKVYAILSNGFFDRFTKEDLRRAKHISLARAVITNKDKEIQTILEDEIKREIEKCAYLKNQNYDMKCDLKLFEYMESSHGLILEFVKSLLGAALLAARYNRVLNITQKDKYIRQFIHLYSPRLAKLGVEDEVLQYICAFLCNKGLLLVHKTDDGDDYIGASYMLEEEFKGCEIKITI